MANDATNWREIADALAAAMDDVEADIWQVHGEFCIPTDHCKCDERAIAVIDARAKYDAAAGYLSREATP